MRSRNLEKMRAASVVMKALLAAAGIIASGYPATPGSTPTIAEIGANAETVKEDTIVPLLTARDTLPLRSILKAGDAVHIAVYPDTLSFLTGTYRLAEDGTIDLPMVGPFRIGDMSRLELEKRLAGHYLRYLRYPYVAITPLIRVGFVGGFGRPGFYYVNPNESFWDALRLSGGPLRNDGMRLMRWERELSVVSKNIVPAAESGRSLHDLGIRSGDRFTVTTKPKRESIESFDQDVVPVLQVLLTAISASATLFIVYRTTGGH